MGEAHFLDPVHKIWVFPGSISPANMYAVNTQEIWFLDSEVTGATMFRGPPTAPRYAFG